MKTFILTTMLSFAVLPCLPCRAAQPDMVTGLEEAIMKTAKKTVPALVAVKTVFPYFRGHLGGRGAPAVFEDFIAAHFPDLVNSGSLDHFFSFSGFVVSEDGLVITSIKAASGNSRLLLCLHDGRECNASVEAVDQLNRIALLKIDNCGKLPFIDLESIPEPVPGLFVLALSASYGQGAGISFGVISRLLSLPEGRRSLIYTDALSGSEGCGGPLVDLKGRLAGVITGSSGNSGLSELAVPVFSTAAPAAAVKGLITKYLEKKKLAQELNPAVSGETPELLKLSDYGIVIGKDGQGLYIAGTEESSPASFANIVSGMRINSINREKVASFKDVMDAAAKSPDKILLHIEDGSSRYFIVLTR